MNPHLSFVTLAVRDLAASRSFWEGMGLVADGRSNDRIVWFQLNGVVMALYGEEALAEDAGVTPAEEGTARITLAHNLHSREAVDSLIERARSLGASISQPPAETHWGGYRGYFLDPDGHAWELAWNPFVTWDEKGGVWLGHRE